MRKPHAQTLLKWLRDNGMRLGALTDHDTRCLLAAVQIAEVWICSSDREPIAEAFARVVMQMQDSTKYLAFHCVAHVADWCHRGQLWRESGLPFSVLENRPECTFGPQKAPHA